MENAASSNGNFSSFISQNGKSKKWKSPATLLPVFLLRIYRFIFNSVFHLQRGANELGYSVSYGQLHCISKGNFLITFCLCIEMFQKLCRIFLPIYLRKALYKCSLLC